MGQFQCRTKNNSRKRDLLSNINYNHDTLIRIYKQGYKQGADALKGWFSLATESESES